MDKIDSFLKKLHKRNVDHRLYEKKFEAGCNETRYLAEGKKEESEAIIIEFKHHFGLR